MPYKFQTPVTLLLIPVLNFIPVSEAREQQNIGQLLQLSIEDLINLPITSTSYFNEDSISVGSTVSIISTQDWQQRGARRTHDALLVQPSVAIFPSFLGQYSVRIRGFAQPDARGVETLWDGVPLSSFNLGTADINRPNIHLNTLNNIEVTRSPGSAFYGTGAFHGVVALNAFESDYDTTHATIGAATNGYYSSAVQVSRAIGKHHRLNFALGGNGQNDQDMRYIYTDPGSGLTASSERRYQYDTQTAVLKFNSDPKQDLSYKLGLYYDNNDQDGFHGQGLETVATDESEVDSDIGIAKFSIKQKLDADSSIEAVTYHWQQRHNFAFPLANGNNISIASKEKRTGADLIFRKQNLFNNTQLSMALGYRREKIPDSQRTVRNPSGAVLVNADQPFKGGNRTIHSFLFDNNTNLMNDKLILRYGLRYDDYSDVGSQTTPRLGIIYALDNNHAVKLLYGNAFRAPTVVEKTGNPRINSDPNIQPETIDTYELVYLQQARNSMTEVVFFTSKWKDSIIAADTDNDTVADLFTNSGDNHSRGIEISHQADINNWQLRLSGSYVRSKNKSTNEEYATFPQYIFNIGTGYRFDDSLSMYVNNRIHLQADNRPAEGTLTANELRDYWRTDLNVSKAFNRNLTLYANIRNLFDRENFLPSMEDMEYGIQDEEISFELGLRYRFDN